MATDADKLAQRCADAMYAADEASRALGIRIAGIGPGRASAHLTVGPAMLNGHGSCHGGYLFLLADTAFAFACNTYGQVTVAAAGDVVFVSPVRLGDELVAAASERVRFGRSGVYDVTVRRLNGTVGGEVVAEFRGQGRTITRPDGGPGPRTEPGTEPGIEPPAGVRSEPSAPAGRY